MAAASGRPTSGIAVSGIVLRNESFPSVPTIKSSPKFSCDHPLMETQQKAVMMPPSQFDDSKRTIASGMGTGEVVPHPRRNLRNRTKSRKGQVHIRQCFKWRMVQSRFPRRTPDSSVQNPGPWSRPQKFADWVKSSREGWSKAFLENASPPSRPTKTGGKRQI